MEGDEGTQAEPTKATQRGPQGLGTWGMELATFALCGEFGRMTNATQTHSKRERRPFHFQGRAPIIIISVV